MKFLGKADKTVSREDVIWCYRNLLRREPESEAAVLSHLKAKSFKALVECFVQSPEYSGSKSTEIPLKEHLADDTPPISEQDFRKAIDGYLQHNKLDKGQLEYIDMHFARLLETINAIHRILPNGGSVIDYSSTGFFRHAVDQLIANVIHTNVTGVNYEQDEYITRYGTAKYDLCVNTEVLEHLLFDPSHMFYSINKMLKPGGYLFLSTPNAISLANCIRAMNGNAPTLWNQLNITSRVYYQRHNRDWTPFEVSRILQEHGFDIMEVYTKDCYESTKQIVATNAKKCELVMRNSTHEFFGDTLLVLAKKEHEVDGPVHNSWLYVLPGQS